MYKEGIYYNVFMKYVLFDFNGTVIDDLDLCIKCINMTIEKYLDRKPLSKEEYYQVFTFPIKDYYEKVGFDFSVLSWEEVGRYWFDNYYRNRHLCHLHEGIREFLIENRLKGNRNIILSASKIEVLKEQLSELGVIDCFDEILGLNNIYANSKLAVGLDFIKDKNRDDCIMIGDSLHDYEVAREMGIRCILIARGHQDRKTLEKECDEVYDSISEVKL